MTKQAFNPYLPSWEYVPDAEPHVVGDRVYVKVSDDYGYWAEIRSIEKGQDDDTLEISAY